MFEFQVNDMSCGHCVSAITKALKAADKNATVQIDLAARRVQVDSSAAGAEELAKAIEDAGYRPTAIAPTGVVDDGSSGRGCGCGCRR